MDDRQLARAYELARTVADEAADQIRAALGRAPGARTKRHAADWVTETDEQVERFVRARLLAAFPQHRVVGEEQGMSGHTGGAPSENTAPTWYLDPIDGTANFVHGIPWVSFSLGLAVAGEPALGVVMDPVRGELFHAVRDGGAFVNGEPVRLAADGDLTGAMVLTELASHVAWPGMRVLLPWLSERHALLRVMGSSALSMAMVAAGRGAAVALHRFQPWDITAGTVLCREAGLLVRDGAGRDSGIPEDGLIAGHPRIVAQLWEVMRAIDAADE